jgi:hypothetical protein
MECGYLCRSADSIKKFGAKAKLYALFSG